MTERAIRSSFEALFVGNLGLRSGIDWDAEHVRATGASAADAFIIRRAKTWSV